MYGMEGEEFRTAGKEGKSSKIDKFVMIFASLHAVIAISFPCPLLDRQLWRTHVLILALSRAFYNNECTTI
jgi:hypothetical protein